MRHLSRYQVAFAGCLLACALGSRPASAQVSRDDSAAVLVAAAADLEREGEVDAALALYRHVISRFLGTPGAEAALMRLQGQPLRRAESGARTGLMVWSTFFGLGFGASVPHAFGASSSGAYGLGLLLGGPTGFLAGRAYANANPLTSGQTQAITWGGLWGWWQGYGWAVAMDLGGESGTESSEVTGAAIVGGLLGIVSGGMAARREITAGTATAATLGSVWGTWFGVASSIFFGLYDGDTSWWVTTLVAGNGGLIAGALAGDRWSLSRRRVLLTSVGGVIGGFGGIGAVLIGEAESDKTQIGIPLLGSMAGLAVGALLTRGEDREEAGLDTNALRPGGGVPNPGPGALVNRIQGRWSVSVPMPYPVRVGAGWNGGPGYSGTSWRIPLLRARF